MKITYKDLRICHSLAVEAREIMERAKWIEAFATKTTALSECQARDRVGDGTAELIDFMRKSRRRANAFILHVTVVGKAIERLDNERQRRVLSLRYMDGLSWEAVCERAHYSMSWAKKLHDDGLVSLGVRKGKRK